VGSSWRKHEIKGKSKQTIILKKNKPEAKRKKKKTKASEGGRSGKQKGSAKGITKVAKRGREPMLD